MIAARSDLESDSTLQPAVRRKVIVIGDMHTGKSSLLQSYSTGGNGLDSSLYAPTIFDNTVAMAQAGDRDVELALWDTSGHHTEYSRVRLLSFQDTDAVLLCFSIEDKKYSFFKLTPQRTLENLLGKWSVELKENIPDIPIVMVGCKSDLRKTGCKETLVREIDARRAAERIGAIEYRECSAKTGSGVLEVFESLARVALLPNSRDKTTASLAGEKSPTRGKAWNTRKKNGKLVPNIAGIFRKAGRGS